VGAVVGVLPDGARLAAGELVEPVVFLEVALDNLDILGLARGRVGHTGVGDHTLDALDGAAEELGQVLAVVEPVVVAAEKLEGVGAAAVAGFDQAVGQPGAGVGAALGEEDGVLRIGHDIAVALAARGDAVDDPIEALAQLGVRGPAQGVAGAHEGSGRHWNRRDRSARTGRACEGRAGWACRRGR